MVDLNNIKYGEIEKIFGEITDKIRWYESCFRYNNNTFLKLSNGNVMNVRFPKKSIAHLLGINTTYLKNTNLFGDLDGYELLKYIVNNPYYVSQKVNAGYLNYRSFISEYVYEKLEVFVDNTRVNFNSIEFICNFDKARCNTLDGQINVEYFIGQKIEENIIALLGFVKDSGSDNFVPVTSQIIDVTTKFGENILDKYLRNQTLLMPIFLRADIARSNNIIDSYSVREKPLEIKSRLSNLRSDYAEKYDCIIDVGLAYDFELKKELDIYNSLDRIIELIEKNDKIDISLLGRVPKQILDLVKKLNTLSLAPDDNADLVLELRESLNKVNRENERLILENKSLIAEKNGLKEENISLKTENDNLNECISEASMVLARVLKK